MIKSIHLLNIMSHEDTLYEFPKTGIVRISGENSNGKSVLTKVLNDTVIQPSLHLLKKRIYLIRRGNIFGELTITFYNEKDEQETLIIHIDKEIRNSYYKYSKNESSIFVDRQLLEIKQLCASLGFCKLSVYKSLMPLIFATTSPTENFAVLSECITDYNVEVAVKNLQQQLDIFLATEKELKSSICLAQGQIALLPKYDLKKETEFISNGGAYANVLRLLSGMPIISKLNLPKVMNQVEYIAVKIPYVIKIKTPIVLPKVVKLPVLPEFYQLNIAWSKNLESLKNKICPVCGRDFISIERE